MQLKEVVKKDVYNAKVKNIEYKIPYVTNLATTTVLNAVENKVPNVSNFVKKLTIIQKLVKLKIKLLLIMIMINILLLINLITSKFNKQM